MGTNFYLHQKPPCECCGRPFDDALHIGESSSGWCFTLHVIPEDGINDLDDWRRLWSAPGAVILDEYGESLSPEEMEARIKDRGGPRNWNARWWEYCGSYSSEVDFHRRNMSERGPNGLLRHAIGDHCIKHGEGTWDCIIGEFS